MTIHVTCQHFFVNGMFIIPFSIYFIRKNEYFEDETKLTGDFFATGRRLLLHVFLLPPRVL